MAQNKIAHTFKRDELIHLQKIMLAEEMETDGVILWVMIYGLFSETLRKVNKALLDEQKKYTISFSIPQAAAFNLVLGDYGKESNDAYGIALIWPMIMVHDQKVQSAGKLLIDGPE